MEFGLLITIVLRFGVPLSIFRWPLVGGLASFLIDTFDCQIATLLGGCRIPNYILTDKYFDLYYLTIELAVSRTWANKLAKNALFYLYIWRLLGIGVFQLTGQERWLVLTPNIFEYFFLFVAALLFLKKETAKKFWIKTSKRLAVVIFLISLVKIPQEILLHLWKMPLETVYRWLGL